MKRLLIVLLALGLATSAFAAGEGEAAGAMVVITHMVADRNIVPPEVGTIDDNWYTQLVDEHLAPLGIDVDIVVFPRAEYDSKVVTLLAAGDAPDVMWTWKFPPYGSQAGEWTLEGGLLDYGPYLEEFGPNLLNLYSEKDLKAGSFYGQQVGFRRLQTTNQWSVQTFIRQDYLDVLGLEQPRTIDEVYELAVTLKANADKLGQDPETFFPIQPRSLQWIPHRYLLSAFLDETPGPERMVVPWQMWPEAKDAARWLNKLYNEGLAADLTVDRTMHGQMVINGQTAIIPWVMHSPIFVGYGDFYNKMVQNNPDAKLEPIYPWTKDTSLPYWNELFGNPGYGLGFITPSNTKHPQQVVQYLDYLASDLGRQTMILGVEGQDWEKTADGGFRRLISPQEVTDRIAWIQPQWEVLSLAFPDSAALNGQALYGTQFRGAEYVEWVRYAEQNYPVHPAPVVSLPVPERNRSWGAINGDWNNALPKILVASPEEFDALWDAAIKAFRDNGGDAVAVEAVANYEQWVSQ